MDDNDGCGGCGCLLACIGIAIIIIAWGIAAGNIPPPW